MTTPPQRPLLSLARAQRHAPGQHIPSPCVGICTMDPAQGWCAGCFRTLDEISGWSRATDATKREVWAHIEQRQLTSATPATP